MFQQILNPAGNLFLTWLIALIPVALLLILLAVLRMSAWLATLIGSLVTLLLALTVWKMPLGSGVLAYLYGSATGVWNVDWITFWGVMLFNTLVITGVFEQFRRWILSQGTNDIRVQTMLRAGLLRRARRADHRALGRYDVAASRALQLGRTHRRDLGAPAALDPHLSGQRPARVS
jgi:lactate permease